MQLARCQLIHINPFHSDDYADSQLRMRLGDLQWPVSLGRRDCLDSAGWLTDCRSEVQCQSRSATHRVSGCRLADLGGQGEKGWHSAAYFGGYTFEAMAKTMPILIAS